MAGSGCPRGRYGCTLWVSLEIAWAMCVDKAIVPTPSSFTIFLAEPRLLIVKMNLPAFVIVFVVVHAAGDLKHK